MTDQPSAPPQPNAHQPKGGDASFTREQAIRPHTRPSYGEAPPQPVEGPAAQPAEPEGEYHRIHLIEPSITVDGRAYGAGWLLISEAEYASLRRARASAGEAGLRKAWERVRSLQDGISHPAPQPVREVTREMLAQEILPATYAAGSRHERVQYAGEIADRILALINPTEAGARPAPAQDGGA